MARMMAAAPGPTVLEPSPSCLCPQSLPILMAGSRTILGQEALLSYFHPTPHALALPSMTSCSGYRFSGYSDPFSPLIF